MSTLFVDTHSELITIGLKIENEVYVKTKESEATHSVYTLNMIKSLLEEHNILFEQLTDIVVVNGPGSFTGIRIGLSIVKTMAYALNIPVYVISSLKSYLISSDNLNERICVIPDSKGFYICGMDDEHIILEETYLNQIEEYAKYEVVENILNVDKVITYAHKFEPVNPHSIKANYVKKIEAQK